jgi:hypothetical protein
MSTAILAPSLILKSWRNDGTPNVGGKVYTYQAGTTTPIVTYTDSTGTVTNSNPITLNSRGEWPVWVTPNVLYKFVEYDSAGTLLRTTDQVTQQQLLSLYGGTDTGVANAYLLAYNAPYTAYQDGIGIYWAPAHTNTGPSTVNVSFNSGTTFAGVVSIVNQDGSALGSGELVVNQLTFMMYLGGKFVLTNPLGGSSVITMGGVNVTGGTIPTNGINFYLGAFLGLSAGGFERVTINSTTGQMAVVASSSGQTLVINGGLAGAGVVAATMYEVLDSINALKSVATYEVGTFTGTLTGCTTSPTATFNWSRNGNAVTIDCPTLTATSNTTACTVTGLPAALTPARTQLISVAGIEDGSVVLNSGSIQVSGTTLTLLLASVVGARVTHSNNTFSNVNIKGISTAVTITYNLT